jgi:hypothetical protein
MFAVSKGGEIDYIVLILLIASLSYEIICGRGCVGVCGCGCVCVCSLVNQSPGLMGRVLVSEPDESLVGEGVVTFTYCRV